MDNFIYQPKTSTRDINEPNAIFYCLNGLGDDSDKDNNSLCKKETNKNICAKKIIRDDNSVKYLIKTGDDRKLYNPISIYSSEKSRNFLESIARNQNSFKEVNNSVFSLYLRFLKTKNIAYLHQAERGL